ncbi:MAG: putative four-helix membrane protein [Methylococcaceae bacterium]
MNIKRLACGFGAFISPLVALADNYEINDNYEYGVSSGGGSDLLGHLLIFVGAIAAYFYLFSSYEEWKKRKVENEKPQKKNGTADWALTIIGYLVVALFISLPFLLIIKWVGSVVILRQYWLWAYTPSFIILAYFRRT